MEKFYNTKWDIDMNILEYLRYVKKNRSIGNQCYFEIHDRKVFSDYIQENIVDNRIATIKLPRYHTLFVGLEFRKAIIMDFLNSNHIQIDFEDLNEDDSYLILKYSKILIEEMD